MKGYNYTVLHLFFGLCETRSPPYHAIQPNRMISVSRARVHSVISGMLLGDCTMFVRYKGAGFSE